MSKYRDAYNREMWIQTMSHKDDIDLEDVPPVTRQDPPRKPGQEGLAVYGTLFFVGFVIGIVFHIAFQAF